jgi:hypothetical protein
MSVPLDRLYHFLESLIDRDVIIYHWIRNGVKDLKDLRMLNPASLFLQYTRPTVIMHDQEPLWYDFYGRDQILDSKKTKPLSQGYKAIEINQELIEFWEKLHLKSVLAPSLFPAIITHSELKSREVEKYQENGYVTCYYWAHGVIAKDWYRFADHDLKLTFNWENIKHDFLIYNRDWSSVREYRLKFSEALIDFDLVDSCKTSFSAECNGINFVDHKFCNKTFGIQRNDIDRFYVKNTAPASSSADYCSLDYVESGIEVVLETLFDDTRWHLTEKILRPIACGKPFILASSADSLTYLTNYGFKTFDPLINETYNTIENPHERLIAIVTEMKRIQQLPLSEKKDLFIKLHAIAQENKQRFFSSQFDDTLTQEFVTNVHKCLDQCENQISMDIVDQWLAIRKKHAPEAYQELADHYDQIKAMIKIL